MKVPAHPKPKAHQRSGLHMRALFVIPRLKTSAGTGLTEKAECVSKVVGEHIVAAFRIAEYQVSSCRTAHQIHLHHY